MTVIRISSQLVLIIFLSILSKHSFGQIEMIERPKMEDTEIRYYGTACFTIQRGDNVILTDPFVGNPSAGKLMFGKIRTDSSYVERYINPPTFRKVKMVIAAHAHYDHLMDMPYLSRYVPSSTPIVSNRTAKHLLAYYSLPQTSVIVNDSMGTQEQLGLWHYNADSTIRTMAFASLHPPHVAGINFFKKRYTSDLVSEPIMLADWQEGKTLSFMVDMIEVDTIGYRMFFMSSMARSPFGMFPQEMLKERGIDDLFIGASGPIEYESYPGPIVELASAKRIFLIHWENFLRSKEKDFKAFSEKGLEQIQSEISKRCGKETEIITPIPLNYY